MFFLLVKYVSRCKSISFFDFLFNSKELASSTAFRLKSFKDSFFDLVKSDVCKTIILFKLSTNRFMRHKYIKDLPSSGCFQ